LIILSNLIHVKLKKKKVRTKVLRKKVLLK